MAKILRATQKQFGSLATSNELAKFGSLAAGTPVRYDASTVTPALIQSLSNFLTGWFGAVIGGNSPAIEDMNSLCYLFAYQLGYILQQGIAEWDSGTTYFIGSKVTSGGMTYTSLTDTNLNNAVTDTANWVPPNGSVQTKAATYTALNSDSLIKVSATHTETLPTSPLVGQRISYVKTDSSATTVTFASGATTISGAATTTLTLTQQYSFYTFQFDGTNWFIVSAG